MMALHDQRRVLLTLAATLIASCGNLAVVRGEILVEVTERSGALQRGELVEWSEGQLRVLGEEPASLDIAELASVDFPAQQVQFASADYVVLTNGDRIAVTSPRIVDDHFTANWSQSSLRPAVRIPLELVTGLLFELPPARQVVFEQLARLSRIPPGADRVSFLTGDEIGGELQSLDGGLLTFSAALGVTSLDRRRVRRLALDPDLTSPPPLPASRWVVFLTDGSRVTAERVSFQKDASFLVTPLVGEKFFVPAHAVARIEQFSPTYQSLSVRRPQQVEYTSFLDERSVAGGAAWRADRNLRDQPLLLRNREYSTGIGMQSQSTIQYAIEPGDLALRAIVGIDDLAREQGAVVFRIELDGETVWNSGPVDGSTSPVPTPLIDLVGHHALTLAVDFGERGDVGDLADWADAAILRRP